MFEGNIQFCSSSERKEQDDVGKKRYWQNVKRCVDAIFNGSLFVIDEMIQSGKIDVNATDECGWTLLMNAASRGKISIVAYLVDRGVDLNAKTLDGNTALDLARMNGKTNTVAYLLQKGAHENGKGITSIIKKCCPVCFN